MARPRLVAKLEWHAGSRCYGIRYTDWSTLRKNGEPTKRLSLIDAGNGQRVTSKAAALPYLAAYLAKAPPAPAALAPGSARLTLLQIAQAWHRRHYEHATRNSYLRAAERFTAPVLERGTGWIYPEDITKNGVEEWRARRKGLGCDRMQGYMLSMLNWAAECELAPPLPELVKIAMRPPQSERSDYELMTEEEHAAVMAIAREDGHEAIIHCLSLYGWRAKTACLANVGNVDLEAGWIRNLWVKHTRKDKKPKVHSHELHPETIELLRPLVEGRDPSEPLFTFKVQRKDGVVAKRWRVADDAGGGADQLGNYYQGNLLKAAPGKGRLNALKRFAIWRMEAGIAPWKALMTDKTKTTFTGHRTEAVVARYKSTNRDQASIAIHGAPPDGGRNGGGKLVVDTRRNDAQGSPKTDPDAGKVIQFPVKKGKVGQ